MKNFILKKQVIFTFLIIIFIILLIVLIPRKKEELLTYKVKRCDVNQVVSVTGSLKASKEINLASQIAGVIKKIHTAEGEKVKKGKVLIKIDDTSLREKVKGAEANLEMAKENLEKLKKGASPKEITLYQSKVDLAKKELKNALDNLENTKSSNEINLSNLYQGVYQLILESYANSYDALNRKLDPLFENDQTDHPSLSFSISDFQLGNDLTWKRKVCNDILENWKKEIDNFSDDSSQEEKDKVLTDSENNLKSIQKIFPLARDGLDKSIDLSDSNLANYKDLVNLGESEVLSSLKKVDSKIQSIKLQKETNKKLLDSAENLVQVKKSALEVAEKELELKTSPAREEDIKEGEANLKKAKANLNYYLNELKKTEIKAPTDGIVTELPVEVGDFVNIGQKVAGFMSLGNQKIEVNISEVDIAKVKVGDKVKIDFDALPDEEFSGSVLSINPASTVISGVVYYKVSIVLDKSDPRLKPGMTANLDILTFKKGNVLCLPYQYLNEEKGEKFVYLKKGKEIEKRKIKTGLEGENNVEILEGLKEGDEVVLK